MRKLREVLRLRFGAGLGYHQIARSCGVSTSTARSYAQAAEDAGLGWPLPEELDDRQLVCRLFPGSSGSSGSARLPLPDFAEMHRELRRKGVTLQLLWEEYHQDHLDGYRYSQFCERYRRWKKTLDVCLRQDYRAGEKMFVDFAGQTTLVTDPETGSVRQVQLFVAALGASPERIARSADFDLTLLAIPDALLPVASYYRLHEQFLAHTGNPDFGLLSGRVSYMESAQLFLYLASASKTWE